MLARNIRGQINWETKGIVQTKHHLTGNDCASQSSNFLIKYAQPLFQRLCKPLLFLRQRPLNHRLGGNQFS